MNSDAITYKRHDHDEWYDEIRISVKPRYKTSGMSSDEWRVSALVEVFRKGVLLKERSFSKMHYAADFLPAMLHEMADEGFSGSHEQFERLCAQPGCKQDGVVEYRIIDQFYPTSGDKMPKRDYLGEYHRRFCEEHAKRGDCGLEDADSNYELISAPPGWEGNADLGAAQAESPSGFAGVISSIEELPDALKRIRDERKGE